MIELLNEVNWFKPINLEKVLNNNKSWSVLIYKNAPYKRYMRFLKKRVYLCESKGILYLYSPLTLFAWLSDRNTIYNTECNKIEIPCLKEDCTVLKQWFKSIFNIDIESVNYDDIYYISIDFSYIELILDLIRNNKTIGQHADLLKEEVYNRINNNKEGVKEWQRKQLQIRQLRPLKDKKQMVNL